MCCPVRRGVIGGPWETRVMNEEGQAGDGSGAAGVAGALHPARGVQAGRMQGAGRAPAGTGQGGRTARGGEGSRVLRADRLRVRVLPQEMERWREAARESGAPSLSGWLRALADQAVAIGDDPRAWRADLARLARDINAGIGTNLNQVAKSVHEARRRGGDSAQDRYLSQAADALAAMAADLAALRADLGAVLRPRHGRRKRQADATTPQAVTARSRPEGRP